MNTYTIVAKFMAKLFHPLGRPFFGPITPGTVPFFATPWVPRYCEISVRFTGAFMHLPQPQ